jgi:ribonuclease HI
MEALALHDGIRLALDLGHLNVIIKSDAQDVVRMLNEANFARTELASICYEIQDLCSSFRSCSIVHINREANEAAHRCAKQASVDRRRCIWVNYTPVFLLGCTSKHARALQREEKLICP